MKVDEIQPTNQLEILEEGMLMKKQPAKQIVIVRDKIVKGSNILYKRSTGFFSFR